MRILKGRLEGNLQRGMINSVLQSSGEGIYSYMSVGSPTVAQLCRLTEIYLIAT